MLQRPAGNCAVHPALTVAGHICGIAARLQRGLRPCTPHSPLVPPAPPAPSCNGWTRCRASSVSAGSPASPDCWSRSAGLADVLAVGDRCRLIDRAGAAVHAEVVGFRNGRSLLMPYGPLAGIGPGCRAEIGCDDDAVWPGEHWLGRVIGPLGEPIDGAGPLRCGSGCGIRCARRHRRRTRGSGWPASSTSACVRSTPSSPAAAASGSASSPVPASASPACCRCWRVTPRPTSP